MNVKPAEGKLGILVVGCGAVAVVVGAIGILCDTKVITLGRIWTYVELGAFLAALFAFVSGMRKIKDKFFP